jgi:hypothetical protein
VFVHVLLCSFVCRMCHLAAEVLSAVTLTPNEIRKTVWCETTFWPRICVTCKHPGKTRREASVPGCAGEVGF